MSSVIKVILSILVALMIFLSGWIFGSKNKEKRVKIEVKKAINDLNKEHKKALKAIRGDYEDKLRKKEEIISKLYQIINKLLFLLEPIEGVSTAHIIENLNKNKDRLSKIQEGR
ncbi:hypothetical protein [Prevotella nigrescens]|uniref:hypothetical protein n=1 Tax=Prevotella nigrescens TaxID=28133 RepID=UPI0028D8CE82|nr:hypothetical protein [Prevotella nigrescens]